MKNFCLLAILLLTSCVDIYNFDAKLNKIGIDTEVVASDHCSAKEVQKLISEYRNKKRKERKAFVQTLKNKVESITIEMGRPSLYLDGEVHVLYYVERRCGDSCYYKEISSKTLSTDVSENGQAPKATAILANKHLTLNVEHTQNNVVTHKYYTRSVDAYDRVDNMAQMRSSVNVWKPELRHRQTIHCPAFVNFSDFYNIKKKPRLRSGLFLWITSKHSWCRLQSLFKESKLC